VPFLFTFFFFKKIKMGNCCPIGLPQNTSEFQEEADLDLKQVQIKTVMSWQERNPMSALDVVKNFALDLFLIFFFLVFFLYIFCTFFW
jgi:hypothetical protein